MTIAAASRAQSTGDGSGGLLGAISQSFSIQSQRPEYDRFKYYLTSRIAAKELQEKLGILQILYGGQWDPATRSRIRPRDTGWRRWVSRQFDIPDWTPPSIDSLAGFLSGKIKFESTSSVVEDVKIDLDDPQFGMRLLRWVYDAAESSVRKRDMVRLDNQIEFMKQELQEITLSDQRAALISLLSEFQRRRSLIHSGAPYAAELIDPPHAATLPTSPNPFSFLPRAFFASTLLGIFMVVIVAAMRTQ